ncbi:MAG: S46 family peptidase, partial [Bacteroidota bacterium]
MKTSLILFITLYIITLTSKADEGMWLLPLLENKNIDDMKKMGLKLDAKDIYNINESSLKDAVVRFDDMCTGEIISEKGLLLTNHHCGYDFIVEHSTVENDYLKNGFWAKKQKDELPNQGMNVKFLEHMEDVTGQILSALSDTMTEKERKEKISDISQKIETEAETEDYLQAEVEQFYKSSKFYLSVYKVYKDVRLVGAPPEDIGKYGGNKDNWTWPRHTGDFSLFRVYCNPEGEPAEYDEENVPLQAKSYFSISQKGIQKGDFSMILGYPGSTNRYMTSYEIKSLLEIVHPNRILIRGTRQKIWKKAMEKNDTIKLKYATKYATSSNYYKYSIGQKKCLEEENILQQRRELEQEFQKWAKNKKKFRDALQIINEAEENQRPYINAIQYIKEVLTKSFDIINSASEYLPFYNFLTQDSIPKEELDAFIIDYKNQLTHSFEKYDLQIDKKVALATIPLLVNNVPSKFLPGILNDYDTLGSDSLKSYINKLYNTSIFSTKEKLNNFLDNPDTTTLQSDPAFNLARQTTETLGRLMDGFYKYKLQEQKGGRYFVKGLQQMQKNRIFYPNANFTMRLTYGEISGYSPRDAVYYNHYTTLSGVMEKKDSADSEFHVPEKLTT